MKGRINFYKGTGKAAADYYLSGHACSEVDHVAQAYYMANPDAVTQVRTRLNGEIVGEPQVLTADQFALWVEGFDPHTGEQRGQLHRGERESVKYAEFSINNPKTLSLLESQDPEFHALMESIRDLQRDAVEAYISKVALTRVGKKGEQQFLGGLALEFTEFRHESSREGDPHYHQHLAVNCRVFDPLTNRYRALDTASLRQHTLAINALGERVRQAMPEFHAALAERGFQVGVDGEIEELRDLVQTFSKRRSQILYHKAELHAQWQQEHPGQRMSQETRDALDKLAWNTERKRKGDTPETSLELSSRVAAELSTYGVKSLSEFASPTPLHAPRARLASELDVVLAARVSLQLIEEQFSSWNATDVRLSAERVLMRSHVVDTKEACDALIERIVSTALAQCNDILEDGFVPTPTCRNLTSSRILDEEFELAANLALLSVDEGPNVAAITSAAPGLSPGQLEALGLVASKSRLGVVIGPAGTGKTTMLKEASRALLGEGRRMVLVSPSKQGANIAAAEVGVEGFSVHALLVAHGFIYDQEQHDFVLDERGRAARQPVASVALQHHLDSQTVVIVDEASMLSRQTLLMLTELINESGASLRLVGDPNQLGAVGRGGAMQTAARYSASASLDQVYRFLKIETNEAGVAEQVADTDYVALMNDLRGALTPDETAQQLVDSGRVVIYATPEDLHVALAKQAATQLGGRARVAVTTSTNSEARELSINIRRELVLAGLVDDHRVVVTRANERIGVGDMIMCRQNNVSLGVANRERFVVEGISDHSALTLRSVDKKRSVTLPYDYVQNAVELSYAATGHGQQGVTTDLGHVVLSDSTDGAGLYVGLSRGKWSNTVHVVAEEVDDAVTQLSAAIAMRYADTGLDDAKRRAHLNAQLVPGGTGIEHEAWRVLLGELGLDATLIENAVASPAFASVIATYGRLEKQEDDARVLLAAAIHERSFNDAEDAAKVLQWRLSKFLETDSVTSLPPYGDSYDPLSSTDQLPTYDDNGFGPER